MSDFTTVQIDKGTFWLLKILAEADIRPTPKEIRWLVQQELDRRGMENVVSVEELPCPEGATPVRLVKVTK